MRTTDLYYYTDYGKQRFKHTDSDIVAVCDSEAAARALRRRIDPIEAAYRKAQVKISQRASDESLKAREIRDQFLREIISGTQP